MWALTSKTHSHTQEPFECVPWSHDKTIIKEPLLVRFFWFQIQNHALVLWLSKLVLWPQDSRVSYSSQNSTIVKVLGHWSQLVPAPTFKYDCCFFYRNAQPFRECWRWCFEKGSLVKGWDFGFPTARSSNKVGRLICKKKYKHVNIFFQHPEQ